MRALRAGIQIETHAIGDRGNVLVNGPAPVVPYVPSAPEPVPDQFQNVPGRPTRMKKIRQRSSTTSTTTTQKTPKKGSKKNSATLAALSEDFDAFSTVTDRPTSTAKTVNDFQETDRIDVPNLLLPGAVMTSSDPLTNKVQVAVPSVSEAGRWPLL